MRHALYVLLAGSVLSCSIVSAVEDPVRPLWERQGRYVRIVPQDLSTAPPNDHPVSLPPGEVEAVLSALQVEFPATRRFRRKVEADWRLPVFDPQEGEILGKAISLGLGQAGLRQDLVFLVTGDHDVGVRGLFRKHDLNSGRVFYRRGRLNIIFAQVHGAYPPSAAGTPPVSALGSRTPGEAPPWRVVQMPGVDYHRQDGGERHDWVEIDLQTVLSGLDWTPGQMTPRGFAQDRVSPGSQAAEQGSGTAEGSVPQAAGASAAAPRPGGGTPLGVEGRLALLKRLRERGLISKEVYDARVKETLDRFLK